MNLFPKHQNNGDIDLPPVQHVTRPVQHVTSPNESCVFIVQVLNSNYLRATIHVMGKKRKVGGEEGEVVKEAAAPKVHNSAYPLATYLEF